MRVLMFQERFWERVREGSKCQTIRQKPRCVPGNMLSLRRWTGKPYRSKQEVLRTAVCLAIYPMWIGETQIAMNGYYLDEAGEQECATLDGFQNMEDMRRWFRSTHGLPFTGCVIVWSKGEGVP